MISEEYKSVRGDSTPMTDNGGATAGDYYTGEASKSDLKNGYTSGGKLKGTESDKE